MKRVITLLDIDDENWLKAAEVCDDKNRALFVQVALCASALHVSSGIVDASIPIPSDLIVLQTRYGVSLDDNASHLCLIQHALAETGLSYTGSDYY